jgi:hypothetical protein
VCGVLRWQVLFHKALTPFLVSAYAAVASIIGVACGYFAEGLAGHVRASGNKAPTMQERKASRVEIWLKAQTVVFEKPIAAPVELVNPDSVLPAGAMQRPVRHAAQMAAALDGSETVSIPSTDSIAAAEEIPKPAESLKPLEVVTSVEIVKSVQGLNPTQAIVAVEAAGLESGANLQPGKKPVRVVVKMFKNPAGDRNKLALAKLRKQPKAMGLAKAVPSGKLGTAVIRARFADTPSEIIRRSLQGTG